MTPEQIFDHLLYAPLPWPGKTVRLQRNSLLDFMHRPVLAQPSSAELYHENSKLFGELVSELAAARVDGDSLRMEFVRRRAAAIARSRPREPDVAPVTRRLLGGLSAEADPRLFYAVELYLVAHGAVAFHEPLGDALHIVKELTPDEVRQVGGALRLLPTEETTTSPGGDVLFAVGSFARNNVLLGARGYRRTLVEAGRVAEVVARVARELGLAARLVQEFADSELDLALEADGTEVGTLIAFELEDGHVG